MAGTAPLEGIIGWIGDTGGDPAGDSLASLQPSHNGALGESVVSISSRRLFRPASCALRFAPGPSLAWRVGTPGP